MQANRSASVNAMSTLTLADRFACLEHASSRLCHEASQTLSAALTCISWAVLRTQSSKVVQAIDTLTALARGCSVLLAGPEHQRQSDLMVSLLANQASLPDRVHTVYACTTATADELNDRVDRLKQSGALTRGTVVSASADASLGERYAAVCSAVALGEAVRDRGGHALVAIDSLECVVRLWQDITDGASAPSAADDAGAPSAPDLHAWCWHLLRSLLAAGCTCTPCMQRWSSKQLLLCHHRCKPITSDCCLPPARLQDKRSSACR